jgi:hypothetical protein
MVAAGNAEARVRYMGGFTIVAASGTCTDYDPVGERLQARFTPSGIADNGGRSSLSLFQFDGAQNYVIDGRFGPKFKTVGYTVIYDFADQPTPKSSLRFTSQSPAKLSPTTDFITVEGQIQNYNYMKGCTVDFRLALTRRVE